MSQVSDEQLLDMLWQQDAKDEFQRRLETYSPEKRDELTRMYENHTFRPTPLASASPEELVERLASTADVSTYPGSPQASPARVIVEKLNELVPPGEAKS